MSDYVLSVISAAVLSGVASVLSPLSWRRYTGIVTGMMILCAIAAPISKTNVSDILGSINESISASELDEGEELRQSMIMEELTRRVNEDIERRINDEFGTGIKANALIGVDGEGRITGVNGIEIDGRISELAKQRLCEVYGVEKISVK